MQGADVRADRWAGASAAAYAVRPGLQPVDFDTKAKRTAAGPVRFGVTLRLGPGRTARVITRERAIELGQDG